MKRTIVFLAVTMGCCLVALVCAPAAHAQCFPAPAAPAAPCCAIAGLTFTIPSPPPPPSDFVWAPAAVPCLPVYDVSKGDLVTAWMAKTVAVGPLTFCLPGEDGAVGLAAADPAFPPVGQGFWYLVRTDNVVGDETWNELSPAQVVDRDAPLAGTCPF